MHRKVHQIIFNFVNRSKSEDYGAIIALCVERVCNKSKNGDQRDLDLPVPATSKRDLPSTLFCTKFLTCIINFE